MLAILAISGPAAAAPRPVSGKLSKPGYTVIALASNGKATSVRAKRGRFRLVPPAERVTLHVRGANGRYAGPIVVGRKKRGRRAIVGIRAGARLGRVRVRNGYAMVSKRLRKKALDPKRWARAKSGVPIGAGVFGRVRSRNVRVSVPGDGDLDGVPNPLDIDDDGDLILDNLDRSTAARAAQAANEFHVASGLSLPLYDTVNANPRASTDPQASAFTDQQIEAALPTFGTLALGIRPGASAELDCGDPDKGLVYCRKNGSTGRVPQNLNPPVGPPFPGPPGGSFDLDGDGFGTLVPAPGLTGMFLLHGATTAQISTGDVLIQWVAAAGTEGQCPPASDSCASFLSTLQYVFATVPALVSYSDSAAPEPNSATVSYPVAGPYTGPPSGYRPSGPGTHGNPFPVRGAGPNGDGDVVLTLTFWRPQRRPIKDEKCPPPEGRRCSPNEWIDIGGLTYTAGISDIEFRGGVGGNCPQSAYSSTDQQLAPAAGGLTDLAGDQPANVNNKFTFALNVTQCLLGTPWHPGERLDLIFRATTNSPGIADQGVSFKRQGGRLTVKKQTDPAESSTTGTEFEFDPDSGIGGANFKLRHDGTRTYDVLPGTYTVDELAAAGYDLTGVACDDSDSTGSTADRRATFRIAAAEQVTCTFTNKKL